MRSSVFLRILWKEYRVQLPVWIALLAGSILLQLLYLTFSPVTQQSMLLYPLTVGAVIPLCYAIASGAMMFAKEREEETDRFLMSLAVRPAELLGGKLAWTLLSLSLLLIPSLLCGLGIGYLVHGNIRFYEPYSILPDPVPVYLKAIPVGLSLSLLMSLLSGQVIWALLGSVVLMFLFYGAWHYWVYSLLNSGQIVGDLILTVLLLYLSLSLLTHWIRGKIEWKQAWKEREGKDNETSLPKTSAMFGNFDLGRFFEPLLHWSVQSALPIRRAFGVLAWKELRLAHWVVLIGLLTSSGWLAAWLLKSYPKSWGPQGGILRVWSDWSVYGTVLLVVFFGGQVFGADHRQGRKRFYLDHGISPALVWFCKQVVWISCFSVPAIMIVISGFWTHQLIPLWVTEYGGRVALLMLSLYSIQQLAGQWFRGTYQGFLVGLVVCAGVYVILEYFLEGSGVPFGLFFGPIIVGGLLASYFSMNDWLHERSSWKSWLKRGAWVVVPLAVSYVAIGVWRVREIPSLGPGFYWQDHEELMGKFDPEWTREWQELVPLVQKPVPEVEDRLRMLADKIRQNPRIKLDPYFLSDQKNLGSLRLLFGRFLAVKFLVEDSTRSRPLAEQWRDLETAMTLSVYIVENSTVRFPVLDHFPSLIQDLNQLLLTWVQDPRQTPELLTNLIQSEAVFVEVPFKNYYVTYRQAIEQRGFGKLAVYGDTGFLWFWPVERARAIRGLDQMMFLYENSPLPRAKTHWDFQQLHNQLALSLFASPDFAWRQNWEDDLNSGIWLQRKINQEAMLLRSVALLEKYRLEHGHYPAQLVDAFDSEKQAWQWIELLNLQYYPQGLSKPVVVSADRIIPAGEPILYSERRVFIGLNYAVSVDKAISLVDESKDEQAEANMFAGFGMMGNDGNFESQSEQKAEKESERVAAREANTRAVKSLLQDLESSRLYFDAGWDDVNRVSGGESLHPWETSKWLLLSKAAEKKPAKTGTLNVLGMQDGSGRLGGQLSRIVHGGRIEW